MESLLKLIGRAVGIYAAICATWFLVSATLFAFGSHIVTLDQEGMGMLAFIVFPISVVINLVLIYLLSILERTVLNLRLLLIFTVIAELPTIVFLLLLKSDMAVVFIVHVAIIIICFFIWRFISATK